MSIPPALPAPSAAFAYTIVYVDDVAASLAFFAQAFGLAPRFTDARDGCLHYAELDTGKTVLAFASHALAADLLPGGYAPVDQGERPPGIEIGLYVADVAAVHRQALAAGARELAPPKTTPWGQMVSFIRCPDGALVEICTPTGR